MTRIDRNLASEDVEKVELFSFFSGEKYLSKYLNKLAKSEIYTIGDLVKTQGSFFEKYPTSNENKRFMSDNLAKIGVHLV